MKILIFIFLTLNAVLFLYHIFVYSGRQKDKSNLFYSCILLSNFIVAYFKRIYVLNDNYSPVFAYIVTRAGQIFAAQSLVWFISYIFSFKKTLYKTIFNTFFIIIVLSGAIGSVLIIINATEKIFFTIFSIAISLYGLTLLFITIFSYFSEKQYLTGPNEKNYHALKRKMIFIGFLFQLSGAVLSVFIKKGIEYSFSANLLIYFPMSINVIIIAFANAFEFNNEHKDLVDLKNTLEQKVAERTAELEAAKEEIEEQSQQKTNVFINIAHEIKTPLTITSNKIESYIKKHGLNEDLELIKKTVDRLCESMVNFLDSEKLSRGMEVYTHDTVFNLSEFTGTKVDMFQDVAAKKNIDLVTSIMDDIYIRIDPHAMDRILNNLLDNAIKFTGDAGRINVSLTCDEHIILTVSDTGRGIAADESAHIFTPYHQISHEKSNSQGIGMGLSIVKSIVDDVKGTITVDSTPGKGTMFTLTFATFPMDAETEINTGVMPEGHFTAVSKAVLTPPEYREDRKNILIVEDNKELLAYIQQLLKNDYNCYYAISGKDALEKLKTIPLPDLIISDIMMDDMNGYVLKDVLNNDANFKLIPFIFLSAKSGMENRIKGLDMGAIVYIEKPFSGEELCSQVQTLLTYGNSTQDFVKKNISSEKKDKFDTMLYEADVTEKEREIVYLVLKGYMNKEISSLSGFAESTVKNYLHKIFKKLKISNRSELFKLYFE